MPLLQHSTMSGRSFPMDDHLARQMYQEHILDLYQNPHNFGSLKGATHVHKENNPLCGDEIEIQVIIKNDAVEQVKFIGKGCAISMAASSMLTDLVKGKTVKEIMKLGKEDILTMMNIPIGPVRIKCALLSLETLQKTIAKNGISTVRT